MSIGIQTLEEAIDNGAPLRHASAGWNPDHKLIDCWTMYYKRNGLALALEWRALSDDISLFYTSDTAIGACVSLLCHTRTGTERNHPGWPVTAQLPESQNKQARCRAPGYLIQFSEDQYIPPIPGLGMGAGASASLISVTMHSVVRKRPAMDEAFCIALRTTLAGSIMPALNRSVKIPTAAS